jgi:hypothetical protein
MLKDTEGNPIENQNQAQNTVQQTPSINASEPKRKKKKVSDIQLQANRGNSKHSPGPGDTHKTRHNAVKHGLTAKGLTEFDDVQEYEDNVRALTLRYLPSDPITKHLIERAALDITRSKRIARMEAEYISQMSNRTLSSSDRGAPMIDLQIMKEHLGPVLDKLQRYETAITNRLIRCRRELDRKRPNEQSLGTIVMQVTDDGNVIV